jgi:hypothetical protein
MHSAQIQREVRSGERSSGEAGFRKRLVGYRRLFRRYVASLQQFSQQQ